MTDAIAVDSTGNAERVDQSDTHEAPARVAGVVAETREPVVVDWARSLDGWKQWARWHAEHHTHVAAFHTTRAPLYGWRAIRRLPRGVAVGIYRGYRWVTDVDGRHVIAATAETRDPVEYRKLVDQHDVRVRQRSTLAGLFVAAAAAAAAAAALSGSPELQLLAVLTAIAGLSKLGEERDRPIASRAVVATRVERLTAETVDRALSSAITPIKPGEVTFPSPITRDGPGWRADVDLPHGVTVPDVITKREALASGLRRPAGAVWPEGDSGQHAGRLVLWVGDQTFADARQAAWPLARRGDVDLFKPIPFGADQRHRPVRIPLMYSNVLIGALPGAGKTSALRVLGLACALDKRAEIHVHELKGSGDLESLEQVAHRYGSGTDDLTVEGALESLRDARDDIARRAKVIKGLPRSECPDNKVTTDLADRRHLGLHPLAIIIDECHELFEHPEFGKEAADLATKVIKQGRAFGVILMLATQRPDKDSIPKGVSANAGIRFCLRVVDDRANNMILGSGMYGAGVNATMFSIDDLGIGWLVGATRVPRIARGANIDGVLAMRVGERARQLREGDGLLTGQAAGEEPDLPSNRLQLLSDVLAVVPAGEDKVWSETVCRRLADRWPQRYDGWDQRTVAAALRPHGVKTQQTWITTADGGANRQGFQREHLVDALDAARERT